MTLRLKRKRIIIITNYMENGMENDLKKLSVGLLLGFALLWLVLMTLAILQGWTTLSILGLTAGILINTWSLTFGWDKLKIDLNASMTMVGLSVPDIARVNAHYIWVSSFIFVWAIIAVHGGSDDGPMSSMFIRLMGLAVANHVIGLTLNHRIKNYE